MPAKRRIFPHVGENTALQRVPTLPRSVRGGSFLSALLSRPHLNNHLKVSPGLHILPSSQARKYAALP